MRNSPRSPTVKTNGSSREGNRIINPHSRIPKSTNKQTNKHPFLLHVRGQSVPSSCIPPGGSADAREGSPRFRALSPRIRIVVLDGRLRA